MMNIMMNVMMNDNDGNNDVLDNSQSFTIYLRQEITGCVHMNNTFNE